MARKTGKPCAYCGTPRATTRDHIIPSQLYPDSVRLPNLQLLTVPACISCNSAFKKHEDEFRAFIVSGRKRTPYADELLQKKVVPGMLCPQNASLRRRFLESIVESDVFSPGGLWIGRQSLLQLPYSFPSTLEKIARGLYFHHFQHVVPRQCAMRWCEFLDPKLQAAFKPMLTKWGRYAHRDPRIFEYTFFGTTEPKTGMSVWVMGFLKSLCYAVILGSPWKHLQPPPADNDTAIS